jgi:hypothetical protein
MDTLTPQTLEHGQAVALPLRRGDQLLLLAGSLLLQPPVRWIEGGALSLPAQCWREGQLLAIDDAGSWQARALGRCRLVVVRRTPWWQRGAAALARGLGRRLPQPSRMQST